MRALFCALVLAGLAGCSGVDPKSLGLTGPGTTPVPQRTSEDVFQTDAPGVMVQPFTPAGGGAVGY